MLIWKLDFNYSYFLGTSKITLRRWGELVFPLARLPVFALIALEADRAKQSLNLWFQLP